MPPDVGQERSNLLEHRGWLLLLRRRSDDPQKMTLATALDELQVWLDDGRIYSAYHHARA